LNDFVLEKVGFMDFESLLLDWIWSKLGFGNWELIWEKFGV
jgi:hypothetical protein